MTFTVEIFPVFGLFWPKNWEYLDSERVGGVLGVCQQ